MFRLNTSVLTEKGRAMTKEEQQARATLNDHIVIHKVTDHIFAMHKDGTAVYAVDVIKKPLVRCKDCKYIFFDDWYKCFSCANLYGLNEEVKPDDFCSHGERKGE